MEELAGKVDGVIGALESSKKETKESLQLMATKLEELLQLFNGGVRRSTEPEVRRDEEGVSSEQQTQVHVSTLEPNRNSNIEN